MHLSSEHNGSDKRKKAKSYAIFIKSKENREVFICACEVDQESALIWLRSEMA
jgi:hypothetical protein